MEVGSLLREFWTEETNGNEWNVLGHGRHRGYSHRNVSDFGSGGVIRSDQLGAVLVWSDRMV
jgi:hypothetical protein